MWIKNSNINLKTANLACFHSFCSRAFTHHLATNSCNVIILISLFTIFQKNIYIFELYLRQLLKQIKTIIRNEYQELAFLLLIFQEININPLMH